MNAHLLIVDDDERIRSLLKQFLLRNGFLVSAARDAMHARKILSGLDFDMIVLDVMMPGEDGVSLTKHIRETRQTPILLLTAKGETEDRIVGLEAGADDYLAKPFEMEELLARVEALLRRSMGHAETILSCCRIELDTTTNRVTLDGRPVSLTAYEYRTLDYLMRNQGKTVSKTELTEHIYHQDFDLDSNVIEVLVNRLRQKLGPEIIETRRGLGYCMGNPDHAA